MHFLPIMFLSCEKCGRKGSLDEAPYPGKTLRLKCPYCSYEFLCVLPRNGESPGEPENVIQEASAASRCPGLLSLPPRDSLCNGRPLLRAVGCSGTGLHPLLWVRQQPHMVRVSPCTPYPRLLRGSLLASRSGRAQYPGPTPAPSR